MKKVVILIVAIVGLTTKTLMADDGDYGRIAIFPIVPEYEEVPAGARQQLQNKLGSIVSAYGMESSGGTDRFVITAKINVTEHNIIPSNPTRIQQKMDVIIQIGDIVEKKVFASNVVSVVGLGVTEEKSYISAFSRIQAKTSEMERMIDNAKQQIIAYYEAKCPEIMQQAKMYASQQEYTSAMTLLAMVPNVCSGCYNQSREMAITIYNQQLDLEGREIIQKARSEWSLKHDYEQAAKALDILATINPQAKCAEEAAALVTEINNSLRAEEARLQAEERARKKAEWEFKMRQYEDNLADKRLAAERSHESSMALINTVLGPLAHHTGPFVSVKRSIF